MENIFSSPSLGPSLDIVFLLFCTKRLYKVLLLLLLLIASSYMISTEKRASHYGYINKEREYEDENLKKKIEYF